MKQVKYIFLFLGILLVSCDGFFDVEPTAFIDDSEAWKDEKAVNAILADAYARINHEDFSYFEGYWAYSQLNLSSASDETYPSRQQGEFGTGGKTQVIFGDTWFYMWPYDLFPFSQTFWRRSPNQRSTGISAGKRRSAGSSPQQRTGNMGIYRR